MSDRNIDYDRGVVINVEPLSGMDVYMYVDSPGVYLSAHGLPLSDAVAKSAGYDVEHLAKERVKLERKKTASAAIDAELSDDKDVKNIVVETINGYKLVNIGLGRFLVRDPEDNLLTVTPLSEEHAKKIIALLAEKDEVSAADVNQKVAEQKNAK